MVIVHPQMDIYFGNDINDYHAMQFSGFGVAPIDSIINFRYS